MDLQENALESSDDELLDEDDGTVELNATGNFPGLDKEPRVGRNKTLNGKPQSTVDLIDYRMAGPDSSAGDREMINGVAIKISSQVRDLLCPKGVPDAIKCRMVEVTPDVMYCSGKNLVKGGIEETESMMDRLAEALEDVAGVGAQRQGIQPRDS
jgi:hypothetical protein